MFTITTITNSSNSNSNSKPHTRETHLIYHLPLDHLRRYLFLLHRFSIIQIRRLIPSFRMQILLIIWVAKVSKNLLCLLNSNKPMSVTVISNKKIIHHFMSFKDDNHVLRQLQTEVIHLNSSCIRISSRYPTTTTIISSILHTLHLYLHLLLLICFLILQTTGLISTCISNSNSNSSSTRWVLIHKDILIHSCSQMCLFLTYIDHTHNSNHSYSNSRIHTIVVSNSNSSMQVATIITAHGHSTSKLHLPILLKRHTSSSNSSHSRQKKRKALMMKINNNNSSKSHHSTTTSNHYP